MLGHGQCKKRRLESASLRGSQQQGCEGASVLVVWGNRAVGRVRCAELELLPPNLQLSLQREEGKEGQGVGKAHIEVGPTGVQGWVGGGGEDVGAGVWGLGVSGGTGVIQGHGAEILQQQQQQQQQQFGWRPACFGRVRMAGGGLPCELCGPRELSRHPLWVHTHTYIHTCTSGSGRP